MSETSSTPSQDVAASGSASTTTAATSSTSTSTSTNNSTGLPPKPTTYSTDPALYIYTSLTAGSSHIVTATSRLETILRANRIPFKAVDLATDEKARMLWGRRAGKDKKGRQRKLPALVQMGMVLGVCLVSFVPFFVLPLGLCENT